MSTLNIRTAHQTFLCQHTVGRILQDIELTTLNMTLRPGSDAELFMAESNYLDRRN